MYSSGDSSYQGTPLTGSSPLSRQLSGFSIHDIKDFTPRLLVAKPTSIVSSVPPNESGISIAPATTWAAITSKRRGSKVATPPGPGLPTTAGSSAQLEPGQVPRNRKGQRIDPILKHDKIEVDRVKKMKMCNVHYLKGSCPYIASCSHSHDVKPTPSELRSLRLVARMAPCTYGTNCDDFTCIYGHICPAPEGRNGELCIFGAQCRFPTELHNVDRVAVNGKAKKV